MKSHFVAAMEVPCGALIVSAKENRTSVGAVDESSRGVTVFGILRVTRVGCREPQS